jgi:hypothetical protein
MSSIEPNQQTNNDRKVFLWNVIAGVVASVVFLAFIQPILTLVWDLLTSTSVSAVNSLVDVQYKNAALGERNWVIVGLSIIFLSVGSFTFILIMFSPIFRERARGVRSTGSRDAKILRFLGSAITRILMCIILAITMLYLLVSMYTDLQLNTSFNQRINALAPYISDQDAKLLRSKWALMKSHADHRAISSKMETLAAQTHVKLPELLLPD